MSGNRIFFLAVAAAKIENCSGIRLGQVSARFRECSWNVDFVSEAGLAAEVGNRLGKLRSSEFVSGKPFEINATSQEVWNSIFFLAVAAAKIKNRLGDSFDANYGNVSEILLERGFCFRKPSKPRSSEIVSG